MKLAVGFLTYNDLSAKYLAVFWPSLVKSLKFSGFDYKVLIGDNSEIKENPNADFFAHLKEQSNLVGQSEFDFINLEFNWNGQNLGFAKAYNLLIRRARELSAEYFLVINPDIRLEEKAIKELVDALEMDNQLASVSPKILTWENNKIDTLGLVLKSGLRFFDYGQGQEDRDEEPMIIGPSGAAGLFRLNALEKIKINDQYFDERMFMYREDCDLAYRLFLAGYKSRLVKTAIMCHDRTAQVAGNKFWSIFKNRHAKSKAIRTWSFQNQRLLWKKYWPKQNLQNKIIIFFLFISSSIWALVFERFLFNNSKK